MTNTATIQFHLRHDQRLNLYHGSVTYAAFALPPNKSALGHLVLAATTEGLCVLSFADQPQESAAIVSAMLPNASLQYDRQYLSPYAEAIMNILEGKPSAPIVIDVFGTAFQQQVWQELTRIPSGQVLTYSTLAQKLNKPRAVRAVGTACGANAVSLLIPCHRVVGKSGSLTGFRWGIERKDWLLQHEAQYAELAL